MSDPGPKPKPRTRRWFILTGILVATALLLILNVERQQLRVAELKREIERAGGTVNLADPIYVQLWRKFRGGRHQDFTFVRLEGPAFNNTWFQEHDDLSDISVHYLDLIDCRFDGSELARLAGRHPLKWLRGQNIRNADTLAGALSNQQDVSGLDLPDSDLSDMGLLKIPLERLGELDVSGCPVTRDTLKRLGVCRQLTQLTVDGNQFDSEIRDMILNWNQPRFLLTLRGPSVTDRHLELVREMRVGGNVLEVFLVDIGASDGAINKLMGEFPPSHVSTGSEF